MMHYDFLLHQKYGASSTPNDPKCKRKTATNFFQLFNFRFDIERTESSSFFVSFHSYFFLLSLRLLLAFRSLAIAKWVYVKHHLRSSVRFFIAPQATNQRQAHRELSSTTPPTPSSSASAHETSKEKQLSLTRHSPYTHTPQPNSGLITILHLHTFSVLQRPTHVARTTTIFRMFDQLCRSPRFSAKSKSFPLSLRRTSNENSIEFFALSTKFYWRNFCLILFADECLIVSLPFPTFLRWK